MINHIRQQYITADERQSWMNYENNGNEYLIIGTVVRSKYSNIRYQHLIIGNVQNFGVTKMILNSGNHVSTASRNLLYFNLSSIMKRNNQIIKMNNQIFKITILLLQISFHHIKLDVLINSRTLQYLLKYEQMSTKINGFLMQQITN